MYFKVGLITIIGLSAKNAVLIIEFAKDLQAQGKSTVEAALESIRLRFRPIIMTSLAFMLGVLPLAISSGAGSASQRAIGTGVMGGMATATLIGVVFVPLFFVLVRSFFKSSKRQQDFDVSALALVQGLRTDESSSEIPRDLPVRPLAALACARGCTTMAPHTTALRRRWRRPLPRGAASAVRPPASRPRRSRGRPTSGRAAWPS